MVLTKSSGNGFSVRVVFFALALASVILIGNAVFAGKVPAKVSTALRTVSLVKAHSFFGGLQHEVLKDGSLLVKTGESRVSGFVLPLDQREKGKKLQLRFGKIQNIRYIQVYFSCNGSPFTLLPRARISTDIPGQNDVSPVYYVRIPRGNVDQIQVTFIRRNAPAEVVLKSIKKIPLNSGDNRVWPYVVAICAGILLFFPGVLLYVLIHRRSLSETDFQVTVFAYSLFYYTTVCLFLFIVLALGSTVSNAHIYTLTFFAVLTTVLFWQISRKRLWRDLAHLLCASWREFAAYFVLLSVLCLVISHDANLPITNLYYRDIAGPKTFQAFQAHDGMFQYVNGLAIADNEPFEKYYGNNQLIYNVQDRDMLPGVVYASFRALLSPISKTLAGSYFVYTLLGIAMNLMILFPAAAIAKRFLGVSKTFLLLFLLSANAFMLGNFLITWFKITAGALFLSGLYYTFKKRISPGDWGKSGMFFGLGANVHAGAALGIPFFFLWAVWRGCKEHGFLKVKSYLGPLLLVFVFTVCLMPWSFVKHSYFPDRYILIKQHFLGGYSSPKGLGESAMLFFKNTPLQQEYTNRLAQFTKSFRLDKFVALAQELSGYGAKAFLRRWDKVEFNYLSFVLYPSMLFALLGWIYGRYKDRQNIYLKSKDPGPGRSILGISILTMLVVILTNYGQFPPDIVYHQPMGVLVLANLVLLTFILRSAKAVKIPYIGYVIFVLFRLGLFL